MQKQNRLLPIVSILLVVALFVYLFGYTVMAHLFTWVVTGPQKSFSTIVFKEQPTSIIQRLTAENETLRKQLKDLQVLKQDNKALRDQFETTNPAPEKLLPGTVIGAPGFIPSINTPEYLVLDKGKKDGVFIGQAVVYKDNLVGKIDTVTPLTSRVMLLTKKGMSFTVKILGTEILGVVNGDENEEIRLENVLLSENLKIGDIVVSKGDSDEKGNGIPAGLIIGKLVSIDKKPSNLFQSARIKSFVPFTSLTKVFMYSYTNQ